jgi:hypothetical protein
MGAVEPWRHRSTVGVHIYTTQLLQCHGVPVNQTPNPFVSHSPRLTCSYEHHQSTPGHQRMLPASPEQVGQALQAIRATHAALCAPVVEPHCSTAPKAKAVSGLQPLPAVICISSMGP